MANDINPQQAAKKGKDKDKDVVVHIWERLEKNNTTMSALTGRIYGMNKCIEELESKGDIEELLREM